MKKSLIFVLMSILFLMSACSGQKPVTSENIKEYLPNIVIIDDFEFQPQGLPVDINTEVTWINNHGVDHTIVSQGLFESNVLKKGDAFKFKFTEPGEYSYYCSIHPSMRGRIVVKNV